MKDRLITLFQTGRQTACNADASAWHLIATEGQHPTGDRRAVQIFDDSAFALIVEWFTGPWQKLKKALGFTSTSCVPVWLGHPDFNPAKWPEYTLLGHVAELKRGAGGLFARFDWTDKGREIIAEGKHVFPSVAVECEREPGTQNLTPAILWSVGFWEKPNMPDVPGITTINALADDSPEPEPPETKPEPPAPNTMNKIIAALAAILQRLKLLSEDKAEDEAAIEEGLNNLATVHENALARITTLESELAEAQSKLSTTEQTITTTNASLTDATSEADSLRTSNAALRSALAKSATGHALLEGRITAAEKEATITTINAAADPVAAADSILTKPAKHAPGSPLKLGNARPKLAALSDAETTVNAWCDEQVEKGHHKSRADAWRASKAEASLKEAWQIIEPPAA
jgi:hypothetical protein